MLHLAGGRKPMFYYKTSDQAYGTQNTVDPKTPVKSIEILDAARA